MKCILAACIRNEGPYILEWYCHHKNIGFDEFIVYSNDNDDGSDALLREMHRIGLVSWRPRTLGPNESPQQTAYKHLSASLLSSLESATQYLLWLDMDEFLVLKKHKTIQELILSYECPDGISFNWKHFGSSGLRLYDERPTIERFLLASSDAEINLLVKTIAKIDPALFSQINNHRPQPIKDSNPYIIYPTSEGGLRVPDEIVAGADPRKSKHSLVIHDVAQLNHYSVRSLQEYESKRKRGNGRLPVDDSRCDFLDSYFRDRDLNSEIDDYAHNAYTQDLKTSFSHLPSSLLKKHRRIVSAYAAMPNIYAAPRQATQTEATVVYLDESPDHLVRFKLDRDLFRLRSDLGSSIHIGGVAVSRSFKNIASISLVDQDNRIVHAQLGLPSPSMKRMYKGDFNSSLARFKLLDVPLAVMESPVVQIRFDDGFMLTPAKILTSSNSKSASCLPRYSHKLDFLNMAEILREKINYREVVYIANKGNYGDSLIRYGALGFFREYGLAFFEAKLTDVFLTSESDPDRFKDSVCIYGGSGAWCKVTPGARSIVNRLCDLFSDVIVLPSTYEEQPELRDNLMLWARGGEESYRRSSGYFCHDMAFMIGSIKCQRGDGDAYIFRTDAEASGEVKLPSNNYDLSATDNNYANPFRFFDYISRFSRLYTDRLHVAIAGALLGKEVHLTSSSYFKTKEIYDSSIYKFYDRIHFYVSNRSNASGQATSSTAVSTSQAGSDIAQ